MARTCQITGKSTLMAGRYSNRIRASKFNPGGNIRRRANIQTKRYFVPELSKFVTVNVSAQGMKTMEKNGVFATLKKHGLI